MKRFWSKRRALSLGVIVLAGLMALLLSIGVALAAGEILPRSLMGSGGGQISGGGLRLRSAIGQPVAGAVSDSFTLCSGFICGQEAPGSSGGDIVPPTLTTTDPTDGATDVSLNKPIDVFFSEAMETGSVGALVTPTLAVTPTWSAGDTRLTLVHGGLAAGTRYTVTVSAGSDLSGNPLANAPSTWSFSTGSSTAPEADLALDKRRIGTGEVIAGQRITYTLTITNNGPTTPVTATVVDTFNSAAALAEVSGPSCAWTPGSAQVTCTATDLTTSGPAQLTLIVTTSETFNGPLTNNASVAPVGEVVDTNPANDSAKLTVPVGRSGGSEENVVFLPLVLR